MRAAIARYKGIITRNVPRIVSKLQEKKEINLQITQRQHSITEMKYVYFGFKEMSVTWGFIRQLVLVMITNVRNKYDNAIYT